MSLPYFCVVLQISNIDFTYHTTPVLKQLSFSVKQGEYIAIIGESGSGKSTLLKLIHGEYDLNNGSMYWNHQQLLGPAYNLVVGHDFMKYVAQEFELMPFITVSENIGKFLSNMYPEQKQKRIEELLKIVELEPLAHVKVQFLSGGQKQRVALARALAKEPEIILLDEPFSHIDNFKKQSLRRNLFRYLKNNAITCIVATHDKDDVLGYADQMLVLHQGTKIAHDSPETLFTKPPSTLVASFFGEFNTIEPYGIVYAHQLKIVKTSPLKATVKHSYFKGDFYLIEADYKGNTIFINHPLNMQPGTSIFLSIKK